MWMKIVLVRRSVLERGARTREINHLLFCKRSYRVIVICIYDMMAKLMNYLFRMTFGLSLLYLVKLITKCTPDCCNWPEF